MRKANGGQEAGCSRLRLGAWLRGDDEVRSALREG